MADRVGLGSGHCSLTATLSCSGSSPRGPPRVSDPCLASVGLLEFGLSLSGAACLPLLWSAAPDLEA